MTTNRNYLVEMAELIESRLPADDYTATSVALSILDHLEVNDPDLYAGWLRAIGYTALQQQITRRRISDARRATAVSPSAFQDAVDKSEAEGNTEPLSVFAQHLAISVDNTVRAIGDLTNVDCKFIASRYDKRAKSAAFEAAFYLALASKIPDGSTVSDIMTEEQFLELRHDI